MKTKKNSVRKAPKRQVRKFKYGGTKAKPHARNYSSVLDAIATPKEARDMRARLHKDWDADKLNVSGTETGRSTCGTSNVTEVKPVAAVRFEGTMDEAQAIRNKLAEALGPDAVVGQPFEIDYLAVLKEAQSRFVDGFTLFYGEALQNAWNKVMLSCPTQPGACNRQQLLEFANWFCGPNSARLERQLGVEMNHILNRIERQVITEMVRSRMQNQAKA